MIRTISNYFNNKPVNATTSRERCKIAGTPKLVLVTDRNLGSRIWAFDWYNKNSSGDEIANVNFLQRYGTYVLQNTKKENLLRLTN